jgi:hypothetical protein
VGDLIVNRSRTLAVLSEVFLYNIEEKRDKKKERVLYKQTIGENEMKTIDKSFEGWLALPLKLRSYLD